MPRAARHTVFRPSGAPAQGAHPGLLAGSVAVSMLTGAMSQYPPTSAPAAATAMLRLTAVMARLRDPETGCPWDVEQSFETIAPYTIEGNPEKTGRLCPKLVLLSIHWPWVCPVHQLAPLPSIHSVHRI